MKVRIIALLALLWRFIKWVWSTILFGILVGVLGNLTYTYLTTGKVSFRDPRTLKLVSVLVSQLSYIIPILLVILLLTFCAFLANRSQERRLREASERTAPTPSKQNRQSMLAKVRAFWITGVLEQSLHGADLIALGLNKQRDAVANPWRLVFQQLDQPKRDLPPDTHITDVYNSAGGELLILGEPGSGKTTLLLELTHDLLKRADDDENYPIPVVFNLASWAVQPQPLADWLIEELHAKYQVPQKIGRLWIESDHVLPLLDGLDEVAEKSRAACVETINNYRKEHGLLPTVVCSRSTEYNDLIRTKHRLQLHSAVVVQPLTTHQIDDYLSSAGGQLAVLRTALREDKVLQELATTPLMLNVLTLTYQEQSVEDLQMAGSLATKQHQIFASYVQHMLKRRGASTRYSPQQITHWLSWLARQMRQHNQSVFYLEQLQPDWLSATWMVRAYNWGAVWLPSILIGILVSLVVRTFFTFSSLPLSAVVGTILPGGFLGTLWSKGWATQQPTMSERKARNALWLRVLRWLGTGVLIGLIDGLLFGFGLLDGLSLGLWSILLQIFLEGKGNAAENSPQASYPHLGTALHRLVRFIRRPGVGSGLLTGLLLALIVGLLLGLSHGPTAVLVDVLGFGLPSGLVYGLSSGLLSILLVGKYATVQPVDQLIWSWRSVGKKLLSQRHMLLTVLAGLLFGLPAGLNDGLLHGPSFGLSFGLVISLLTGLGYWLLLGLFQGVSSATIEDQHRIVPNQGIRHSAFNSLVLGLITVVIAGLVGLLSVKLLDVLLLGSGKALSIGLGIALIHGLIIGLSAGVVVGLLNGGVACLRHYVLRFLLWHTGSMPWNDVRFLDDVSACILLRKVGGGYIFLHRLLLDYFADLENGPVSAETAEYTQQTVSPVDVLSSRPNEPTVRDVLADLPTSPLSPAPTQSRHVLPCGHQQRSNAQFCSVCGVPIRS